MARWLKALLVVVLVGDLNCVLYGYDVETHGAIARRAAEVAVSTLDKALKENLGLNDGVREKFPNSNVPNENVQELIGDGARFEDDPSRRVLNHFHNPLQPWGQAGLTLPLLGQRGQSSILWGQNPNQDPGDKWSWLDARKKYLQALTAPSKLTRDESFAGLFRSLGQVAHLVQDATVPAHVRNDAHPCLPILFTPLCPPINPDWYEDWAERNRTQITVFTGFEPIKPSASIFTPTADTQAPVPVARLIDTDRFQSGNSSILGEPNLGLSEFTNGNFLSRDTIFRNFMLPRTSSLILSSPIVEPVGTKFRRYFSKVGEGEFVPHFVTEGMLFRSLQAASTASQPSGGWTMDDRVQEDYARLLLPRAVGYSASLLDYFFRGKLDVDLSTDPNDVTVVRVEGTNASSEKLDGGTLELYGEDANGARMAATPVGSTTITADPGQPVLASFRLPASTEKLMAVYKGRLGNEIPQGVPGSSDYFPGAVIGKLLGRERVEQIFTDFTRWYIRNPQGVFPLPLLKADVDDLQWGDDGDMIVGRSRFGPGETNKFYSYRLNRPAGATFVPLVTVSQPLPDNPTATQIVDMQPLQEFAFPMGVESGTILDFSHTLPYKQYLLWQNSVADYTWIPTPSEGAPDAGHYEGSEQTSYGISLLVDQTATASFRAPIILDEASHVFGPGTASYFWDIWYIHLTGDGKPLALVRVDLSTNNLGSATFLSRTLGKTGGDIGLHPELVELPPVQVDFALPEIGAIWLLVDVSTGQVLANTAPQTLVVHHETARISYGPNPNQIDPPMRSMSAARFDGGPQNGAFVSGIDVIRPPRNFTEFQLCSDERLNSMTVLASAAVPSRFISNQLTLNRAEIAQMEFPQLPNHPQRIINFPTSCGSAQEPPTGFRVTVAPDPSFIPNILDFGILRTAPIGGTEQLVLLLSQSQGGGSSDTKAKLATWNPTLSRIDRLYEFPDRGLHFLLTASRDVAAAGTIGQNFQKSRIVDLVANSFIEIPSLEIFDYLLLEPNYLYNMFDFKFHLKDGSYQSTGLPANLAPTQRRRLGRYHVIAVK
ncbi:MAG: hypothetical protein ACM3SP_17815 [Chloroflexota bacterium]